jgi:hypothetical protein
MGQEKAVAGDYIASLVAIALGILLMVISVVFIVAAVVTTASLGALDAGLIPALPKIFLFVFLAGSGISGWGAREMHRLRTAKAIEKSARKIRTANDGVRIYKEADSQSPLVARLPEESELELGATKVVNGVDWVSARLPDGRQGYVIGGTRTHAILKVVIENQEAIMYKVPDSNSPPFAKLPVGSELELSGSDWEGIAEGLTWLTVWLPDGQRGYIRSNTKVRWV